MSWLANEACCTCGFTRFETDFDHSGFSVTLISLLFSSRFLFLFSLFSELSSRYIRLEHFCFLLPDILLLTATLSGILWKCHTNYSCISHQFFFFTLFYYFFFLNADDIKNTMGFHAHMWLCVNNIKKNGRTE